MVEGEVWLEHLRYELITDKCSFSRHRGTDFLKKAKFYLDTLEVFIEKEKAAELESLSKSALRIPESKRGDFWAWNYPIHWEDIFEEQLRRSFLVSLTSFLENHLKTICWEVAIIKKINEDPRTWREKVYKKSRRLLQKICSKTKDREWKFVSNLYELRNVFVHFGGQIEALKNKERKINIYNFIKSQPYLSESHGFIKLKKEFSFKALSMAENLIFYVHDEIVSLCNGFLLCSSGPLTRRETYQVRGPGRHS
jgi:hypothetical protein